MKQLEQCFISDFFESNNVIEKLYFEIWVLYYAFVTSGTYIYRTYIIYRVRLYYAKIYENL